MSVALPCIHGGAGGYEPPCYPSNHQETVSQLPTTLVTTGKELLAQCPQPAQGSNYTASRTKLEVDSAISVELLWDLVPGQCRATTETLPCSLNTSLLLEHFPAP